MAQKAWNGFWNHGARFVLHQAQDLPNITQMDVMQAVDHMNPKKALGADHWRILELRALSPQMLQTLADFYNLVETSMRWPQILTTTIVALIPKEGAQTEAELRPIGLTPILYRVWMCIRKRCISSWIRYLYGPRIL